MAAKARPKSAGEQLADMIPGRDLMMLFIPMETWMEIRKMAEDEDIAPGQLVARALREYRDQGKRH